VAVVYCNRCGCENESTRGACLRCFNFIETPEGTLSCANCGAGNVADALYCAACGQPVADVPPAVACSLETAINLVLGGESDIGPAEEEYAEDEIAPPGVPELDFEEEAEPEEAAPPPPAESAAEEVAPAPPPAESAAEEVAPAPPPAIEVEEAAPPPPPPSFEEIAVEEPQEPEEELFEPAAEEPDFAPPPPPPAPEEISAEGLLDESEAEVAFEPPGEEAEPEPAEVSFEAPAEQPAEEAEEGEKKEKDLGGWVIDFGDSEDE